MQKEQEISLVAIYVDVWNSTCAVSYANIV